MSDVIKAGIRLSKILYFWYNISINKAIVHINILFL